MGVLRVITAGQTGGVEEVEDSGTASVTAANILKSGDAGFVAPHSAKQTYVAYLFENNPAFQWMPVWTTGTNFVMGGYFRFTSVTPDPEWGFMEVGTRADPFNPHIEVRLLGGVNAGKLRLFDSAGNVAGTTVNAVIQVDTWYRIELYFERSDTGTARLHVNGTEVISSVLKDFRYLTSDEVRWGIFGQPATAPGPCNMYCSGGYFGSSPGNGPVDFLGPFEFIGPYQTDHATNVPDVGVNLTVGNWDDMADTPLNAGTQGEYSAPNTNKGYIRCNGTVREGPLNDAGADNEIAACIFIHRTGAANVSKPLVGKADATPTYTVFDPASRLGPNTSHILTFDASSSFCPTVTDHAVLGWGYHSGFFGNASMKEMWCICLHLIPALAGDPGVVYRGMVDSDT